MWKRILGIIQHDEGKEYTMDSMNITLIALTVVASLLIGGFLGVKLGRHQRTVTLQKKFGPEYEHTIEELGTQQEAENILAARIDHVKALDIRPLTRDEVEDFTIAWQENQVNFVDDPLAATQRADDLITEVMDTKGYPVEDFEQQAADISVDYPDLVMDYRGLHLLAVKGETEAISTEEMRQAMVHGRDLFNKLIKRDEPFEQMKERQAS